MQSRIGSGNTSRCLLHRALAHVQLRLGDDVRLDQRIGALKFDIGQLQGCPGTRHFSLGLLDGKLEGALVDDEQKVALLYHLTVREMDGLDKA